MYIKVGDHLRVKLDLIFKCKRCGSEYHIFEESDQPDKEHIDKFVEYHLNRVKESPLNYNHICSSVPSSTKKYGKISNLGNIYSSAYINYGIGELQGFDIDFLTHEELGEG